MIFTFFRTFERHNSNSNVVTYVMLYINRLHFSRPFRICILCICLDLPICFKNRSNVNNTWFFRNFQTFERHNSNFCDVTYVMLYIFRKVLSVAFRKCILCLCSEILCGVQRRFSVEKIISQIKNSNFERYSSNFRTFCSNFFRYSKSSAQVLS